MLSSGPNLLPPPPGGQGPPLSLIVCPSLPPGPWRSRELSWGSRRHRKHHSSYSWAGPLPSSLWDFRKRIVLGDRELLPFHFMPHPCLAASPPWGRGAQVPGSLVFPEAPRSPSHSPQRLPQPCPWNQAPPPPSPNPNPFDRNSWSFPNTCCAPGTVVGASYT